METAQELLRRYVQDRSEDAFSLLVERHVSLVYRSALRRTNGDAHLAEDITQIVFFILAREASSLRAHAAGWLVVRDGSPHDGEGQFNPLKPPLASHDSP